VASATSKLLGRRREWIRPPVGYKADTELSPTPKLVPATGEWLSWQGKFGFKLATTNIKLTPRTHNPCLLLPLFSYTPSPTPLLLHPFSYTSSPHLVITHISPHQPLKHRQQAAPQYHNYKNQPKVSWLQKSVSPWIPSHHPRLRRPSGFEKVQMLPPLMPPRLLDGNCRSTLSDFIPHQVRDYARAAKVLFHDPHKWK